MSKELVARALAELSESRVLIRSKIIDEPIAALIRAVDAQYGEEYDGDGGYESLWDPPRICACCWETPIAGHNPKCNRWNTRVALLNLCRDILGEKE